LPIFLALGKNAGLKTLIAGGFGSMDESLCTAIQNGLGMNTTLELLRFKNVRPLDDTATLWCSALSFIRTNNVIKSFMVDVQHVITESCLSAFRIDIATMLQENAAIHTFAIRGLHKIKIKTEEYRVLLVTALQHNTTLKTFSLCRTGGLELNDDQDKEIAALVKKNYALARLPDINLKNQARDLGAILRLNGAGRRYLVRDGSSILKGVKVLSRVNNDINCMFLHLLENPRLCKRSAVERVTAGQSNGRWTNPAAGSDGGKRKRASLHKGKSSHSFDSTGPNEL
jgi:hypothetical protein